MGQEQYWAHEPGCEYLVANPIEIPGFPELLKQAAWDKMSNVNQSAFHWAPQVPPVPSQQSQEASSADPFLRLPEELRLMVTGYLPSKDIANLRLASRICAEVPIITFRRLIQEDMPWFWELDELPVAVHWFQLYKKLKFCWGNLKGLRNRKRIWKDVSAIIERIEPFRDVEAIPEA